MHFGALHGVQQGIPYAVVADTPSLKSVRKAQRKVEAANLGHYAMTDTDVDDNVSAVVTFPLEQEQQEVLREYRLRNYGAVTEKSVSLPASGAATSSLSSAMREHPVSNGEVTGATPVVSSKFNCS